jgi:hypothetical protein
MKQQTMVMVRCKIMQCHVHGRWGVIVQQLAILSIARRVVTQLHCNAAERYLALWLRETQNYQAVQTDSALSNTPFN